MCTYIFRVRVPFFLLQVTFGVTKSVVMFFQNLNIAPINHPDHIDFIQITQNHTHTLPSLRKHPRVCVVLQNQADQRPPARHSTPPAALYRTHSLGAPRPGRPTSLQADQLPTQPVYSTPRHSHNGR